MSRPQDSTTSPGQLARYALERRFDAESSDAAYLAYDPRLRRKVVLRLSSDTAGPSAALREARSLARLSHPNVARVHDVGVATFEGRPVNYVAVEYIQGQLLLGWAVDKTAAEVVRAGAELGRALAVLHDADLPHGALKASDVRVDERGRAVVDGLATGRAGRAEAEDRRRADQVALATLLSDALAEKSGPRAPRLVAAALEKGRAAQYDSMASMAEGLLEASASRVPWVWLWLVGAAALAAGVALVLSSRTALTDCETEVAAQRDALWGASRRETVRAAVFGAEVRETETLVEHLEPILGRYAEAWAQQAHENCEARNTAEPAAAMHALEAQRLCLDTARAEFDAFLTVLETVDAEGVDDPAAMRKKAVDRALKSATRLPDLGICARGGERHHPSLRFAVSDADAQQLAWIRALKRAGRDDAAEEAATQMLRREGLEGEVRSRLHLIRGVTRLRARDLKGAEEQALASYHISVTTDDIAQQVRASAFLVSLYGKYSTDFAQAETWLGVAKKHAAHPKADPLMAAVVFQHEGNYLYGRGQYEQALEALDRGIEIRTRVQGAEHDMVYALRNNHASALRALGRSAEAEAEQRRALAYLERTYGTMNPEVARSYNNIGAALNGQGRHAEAVELLGRAIEIWKATRGPTFADLGMAYTNLGSAHAMLGAEEEAESSMRLAVEVWTDAFGPDNYRVGIARNNLAGALVTAAHFERGLAEAEAAYRIQSKALGTEHPDLTYPIANATFAACRLGRLKESRRWAELGLALVVEQEGKLPTEAAEVWMVAAELRLFEAREPGASVDLKSLAIADLTRAREIADGVPEPLSRRANAAVLLADALFEFERPGMAAASAEAIRRIDEGPLTSDEFVKARARLAARVEPRG